MVILAAIFGGAIFVGACSGDDGDDVTGSESDSDSDTWNCSDCEADGHDICIGRVTGRVLDESGDPRPGSVQICPFAADYPADAFYSCNNVSADADGIFSYVLAVGGECRGYSEALEAMFDARIDTTDFVKYPSLYDPSAADLDGSYSFDLGNLVMYAEPTEGVAYDNDSAIPTVLTFDDGTATVKPGLADDREFKDGSLLAVRKFAVDGSEFLPFLPDDVDLDALYYMTPYFARNFIPAIAVSLDASELGWGSSQTGKLYQLGDLGSTSLVCADIDPMETIDEGKFVHCGNLVEAGGRVDFTINTPSWFGVAKDPA